MCLSSTEKLENSNGQGNRNRLVTPSRSSAILDGHQRASDYIECIVKAPPPAINNASLSLSPRSLAPNTAAAITEVYVCDVRSCRVRWYSKGSKGYRTVSFSRSFDRLTRSNECPSQYSRNFISLRHFYFTYLNRTQLVKQFFCRIYIINFRNQAGKPATLV